MGQTGTNKPRGFYAQRSSHRKVYPKNETSKCDNFLHFACHSSDSWPNCRIHPTRGSVSNEDGLMLLFDAPNLYLDGEFIHESRTIIERPMMNQISTTFIPNHDLYGKGASADRSRSEGYVRGEIFQIIFCDDGLVVISVLPEMDTKRD